MFQPGRNTLAIPELSSDSGRIVLSTTIAYFHIKARHDNGALPPAAGISQNIQDINKTPNKSEISKYGLTVFGMHMFWKPQEIDWSIPFAVDGWNKSQRLVTVPRVLRSRDVPFSCSSMYSSYWLSFHQSRRACIHHGWWWIGHR